MSIIKPITLAILLTFLMIAYGCNEGESSADPNYPPSNGGDSDMDSDSDTDTDTDADADLTCMIPMAAASATAP